jgi:cysteine synthase
MMLRLARDDGIFAGISTGANVIGAHRLAERLGPDAMIVTLAVDTAFKYMSVSPLADLEPRATPPRVLGRSSAHA